MYNLAVGLEYIRALLKISRIEIIKKSFVLSGEAIISGHLLEQFQLGISDDKTIFRICL